MIDVDELKFDERGLIPAVVADADTGQILTLAYMNMESLRISMDEGRTCFWSRSRNELWRKGETSGNVQHIVSIRADCDRDALTVLVRRAGPACHTGADSCFFNELYNAQSSSPNADTGSCDASGTVPPFSLNDLFELINDRKVNIKPGSYTSYLFEKGTDKILKKIGEECTEVIIAGKAGDKDETVFEVADLTYHVLVLMSDMGITPDAVARELRSRHVVDHKIKQEKMK